MTTDSAVAEKGVAMWYFIAGMFVGGFVGIFGMALCAMAGKADRDRERQE